MSRLANFWIMAPRSMSWPAKMVAVLTPAHGEILYSCKCFAAAMLALYLALRIGLPRPFWSMMTTYIVASPLSGMVRSKALYRVSGTILGSVLTVFLVPQLANSPELLSFALACWVGLCLAVSLLDRTPRAYVFMLAGYTAALIGFPVVADPSTVFDVAVARVEEITLGIVCATIIHSLLFPRSLGPVLLGRVDHAMADAQRWISAVLMGAKVGSDASQGNVEKTEMAEDFRARRTLAGDVTELRLMSTHLPFDTSNLRWTSNALHALHDRMALIMPAVSAVEDRLVALRDLGAFTAAEADKRILQWSAVLNDIAFWVQHAGVSTTDKVSALSPASRIQVALTALTPTMSRHADWSQLLQLNLAARLHSLVDVCEQSFMLRQHIHEVQKGTYTAATESAALLTQPEFAIRHSILHRDYGIALRSGFAAAIAIGSCCLFWIVTAWPSGATATMMAAVFCCFFATQDDPVPTISSFTAYTALSIPFSALYLLGILPAVHGFEMLALVFSPFFILLGIYAGRPTTGPQVMPVLLGFFGMLTIQDVGNLDLATFLNGMTAQILGMMSAALFTGLLRSVSADWTAGRLLRKGWAELSALAQLAAVDNQDRVIVSTTVASSTSTVVMVASARMLDRIALLTPRLARPDVQQGHNADMALGDLRIGLNMAHLRQLQPELTSAGISLRTLMSNLSLHFQHQPAPALISCPEMVHDIDRLLGEVCLQSETLPRAMVHQTIAALVSLRRDLFPNAIAYQAIGEMEKRDGGNPA